MALAALLKFSHSALAVAFPEIPGPRVRLPPRLRHRATAPDPMDPIHYCGEAAVLA